MANTGPKGWEDDLDLQSRLLANKGTPAMDLQSRLPANKGTPAPNVIDFGVEEFELVDDAVRHEAWEQIDPLPIMTPEELGIQSKTASEWVASDEVVTTMRILQEREPEDFEYWVQRVFMKGRPPMRKSFIEGSRCGIRGSGHGERGHSSRFVDR